MSATLLPLVQAVEQATGRRPHLSTVIRWTTKGSSGVKLESLVLGGRRFTTVENVLSYLRDVTAIKTSVVDSVPMPTPRQAERAAIKSAKKLAERLSKAR
jgi:hypothetical protein